VDEPFTPILSRMCQVLYPLQTSNCLFDIHRKKKYKFNADLETSFPQIYVYKYMYRVTVQVQETLETPELYEKACYFTIV